MIEKIIMISRFLSTTPTIIPMVKTSLGAKEVEYIAFRDSVKGTFEKRFSESLHLDPSRARAQEFYKNNTLSILDSSRFIRELFISTEDQKQELNNSIAEIKDSIEVINLGTDKIKEFKESLNEFKKKLGDANYEILENVLEAMKKLAQNRDNSSRQEFLENVNSLIELLINKEHLTKDEFEQIFKSQHNLIENQDTLTELEESKPLLVDLLSKLESKLKLLKLNEQKLEELEEKRFKNENMPCSWPKTLSLNSDEELSHASE